MQWWSMLTEPECSFETALSTIWSIDNSLLVRILSICASGDCSVCSNIQACCLVTNSDGRAVQHRNGGSSRSTFLHVWLWQQMRSTQKDTMRMIRRSLLTFCLLQHHCASWLGTCYWIPLKHWVLVIALVESSWFAVRLLRCKSVIAFLGTWGIHQDYTGPVVHQLGIWGCK